METALVNRCRHDLPESQCSICTGHTTAKNQTRTYGSGTGYIQENTYKNAGKMFYAKAKPEKEKTSEMEETPTPHRKMTARMVLDAAVALGVDEFVQRDLAGPLETEHHADYGMIYMHLRHLVQLGKIKRLGRVPGAATVRYKVAEVPLYPPEEELKLIDVGITVKNTSEINEKEEEVKADEIPSTKVCKGCSSDLPLDDFGGHAKTIDKKQKFCKSCMGQKVKGSVLHIPLAHHFWIRDALEKLGKENIRTIEEQALFILVSELKRNGVDTGA